jgi:hypothetical protein
LFVPSLTAKPRPAAIWLSQEPFAALLLPLHVVVTPAVPQ